MGLQEFDYPEGRYVPTPDKPRQVLFQLEPWTEAESHMAEAK
jgi:hypothetical protein